MDWHGTRLPWSKRLPSMRPGNAVRRGATALGLLAVAVQLFLPLVVVCKTYKTLTPDTPACCRRAAAADHSEPKYRLPPATDRKGAGPCPYCTAISPFQHARFQALTPFPRGALRIFPADNPTEEAITLSPTRSPCQPRAPPAIS